MPPMELSSVPNPDISLQLWKKYPEYAHLYFDIEKNWEGACWESFFGHKCDRPAMSLLYDMSDSWVPWIAVCLYMVIAFGIQHLMKNRQAFDLRLTLAAWNLFLAVFSFCGCVRLVPHLLITLRDEGFKYTVCREPTVWYGTSASGFWTNLFIVSKLPELIDTLFIVLRKRKLIFLHWYHHVTVLLFCWNSYETRTAYGLYFAAMNFTVHAIMYFYYFAKEVKIWPKWLSPIFITFMQLGQMFVGIFILASVTYIRAFEHEDATKCRVDPVNLIAGVIMYGSYAFLFAVFLVNRYCNSSTKAKGKGKSKGGKSD